MVSVFEFLTWIPQAPSCPFLTNIALWVGSICLLRLGLASCALRLPYGWKEKLPGYFLRILEPQLSKGYVSRWPRAWSVWWFLAVVVQKVLSQEKPTI